ncbi:XrtA/PEP-CTERM system exopolysaccharide export protein [Neptunomonas qingdaonensis]|uniref:Polysaccharide export outer membrane protein n=1 Tax=Neptunomonas qingdaonensis TaxID=1045558 RepID=A0A1I2N1B2_9GAMM|nr:XrtA/PEP-CTERM system exopolysaccharide export protein [Neptunomonas qingdaonensis]SFF95336.1 polysaccharide export outer membrane protein [Neptunomonas qingdaonensis]
MLVFPGNMSKKIKILVAASLFTVISGCANNNSYPPVAEEDRFVQPEYNYVIGAGDSVQIFVWGNAELSTSVTVRPDGKITTNLVEDLEASSKTSTELAREIETIYSEYIKNPVVTVIVNGFVTIPDHRIRVVGAGAEPLRLPYSKHMTLLDLMIEVGGLNEFADGNKAVLVRRFDGEQKTYGLRLDSLLKDGDITANLALKPGDIVIIPEAWF